jgi:endonuclease YncB( thermonuclease family)
MPQLTGFWLISAILLSSVTACSTTPHDTTRITGIANKVHDGDSIHITPAGQKRVIVRLAGIDAPELKQRFGLPARDHLRSILLNKPVEARCHKIDRYERRLCVVYRDGTDINLAMVSAGLAWHYKKYQNEQTRKQRRQYASAEHEARTRRLGLWRDNNPQAPWNYRS